MSSTVDVLIVGGGPAGLAAALCLCRARHSCVLFDSGSYRNARASHLHNVLTQDHTSPTKFIEAARAELTGRYNTVRLVDLSVASVRKVEEEGVFAIKDAEGKEWTGRKLILATGVKDVLPDIPGYTDCWVKGIFHCLYCHGYEETGTPSAGVLAVEDLAVALPHTNILARNALQFASEVTVYTHGSPSVAETLRPLVEKRGIKVDVRPIAKLVKEPEAAKVTMVFEDGSSITHGFLVHKPKNQLELGYAEALGLEVAPSGTELKVTQPFNETTVKGCFAAGDMATPGKVIATGTMLGQFAAVGAVMQLQAD